VRGDTAETARDMGFVVEDEFVFRADKHDAEPKTVLGVSLAAGRGIEDGEEVLDLVADHPSTRRRLARNPAVDPDRLEAVNHQVKSQLDTLKRSDRGFGSALRANELFNAVRQRSSIPAGTCDFDLPGYHHWLQRPDIERRGDLESWQSSFDGLMEAVALCLKLVRESGVSSHEHAPGGLFQRALETATPCQMVRFMLPASSRCFPEISAGRHRFTIRFMTQSPAAERPQQMQDDVDFRLVCCVI